MTLNRPPVSALLPVHNGSKWLNSSIPNILSTLYDFDELLILDDGSNDDSWKIIIRHAKLDNRIVTRKTSRLGLVSTLNLGLNMATHEWIARYDVDDHYPANRLMNQFAASAHHDTAGVVFSDYEIWKDAKQFMGTIPSPIFPLQTKISLFGSQRTAHPSALMRKSIVLGAGGYLESEFPAEDLGLWIRAERIEKLCSANQVGLYYNRNLSSVSSKRKVQAIEMRNRLRSSLKFSEEEIQSWIASLESNMYDELSDSTLRFELFAIESLRITRSESIKITNKEKKKIELLARKITISKSLSVQSMQFFYWLMKRKLLS